MERRKYFRQPLDLPAEFSGSGLVNQGCRIRDYCLGGVLLECERNPDTQLALGAELEISFGTPDGTMLKVEGNVARIEENMLGIAFPANVPEHIHQSLEAEANAYREQFSSPDTRSIQTDKTVARDGKLLPEICAIADREIPELFGNLFAALEQELFQRAEQASSNKDQSAYFEAMNLVRTEGETVTTRMIAQINELIEGVAAGKRLQIGPPEEAQKAELSLVDESEFEDWLVVSVAVSRGEERNRDLLELVVRGLTLIAGTNVDDESNPVGPAVITQLFHDEFCKKLPGKELQKLIYKGYTEHVVLKLSRVYEEIRKLLDQAGVLDEISKNKPKPKPLKGRRETPPPAPPGYPPQYQSTQPTQPATQPATQSAIQAAPGSEHHAAVAPAAVAPAAAASVSPAASQQPAPSPGAAEETTVAAKAEADRPQGPAVHGEFDLLRQMLARQAMDAEASSPEPVEDPQPTQDEESPGQVPTASILDALTQVPARPRSAEESDDIQGAIHAQLAASAPELAKAGFTDDQKVAFELLDTLFENLDQDKAIPEETRTWMNRLEKPLLKVMLQDSEFVSQPQHPARQVINQMTRLATDRSLSSSGLDHTLKNFADQIVEEHDSNPNVYSEVLRGLDGLVERRDDAYERGVQRISRTQSGHQKLIQARREVGRQLADLIGDRPIAGIVKTLIEDVWRDLLVSITLREGLSSSAYSDCVRVVELLTDWLNPAERKVTSKVFRVKFREDIEFCNATLRKGLETASADTYLQQTLTETIEKILAGNVNEVDHGLLEPAEINPELLTGSGISLLETDPGSLSDEQRRLLRRSQRLRQGDSVILNPDTEQSQRVRLAWRADDASRFIFVDDRGIQVCEKSSDQLVADLQGHTAEIVRGEEPTAMDKGVYNLIQDMYKDLAHRVTHDEITGIRNRKEFNRDLDQALIDAKRSNTDSTLLYMDVDQFKVINSDIGHSAGDRLLQELSAVIQRNSPENSIIARLGGDEFGVLLPRIPINEGAEIAEQIRATIADYRFVWERKPFRPSVSIGVVSISPLTENLNAIMGAADSTCYTAKEAGRNRIQVYTEEDQAISRRSDVMAWVSRINMALEEDLLRLRAQKISPLQPGDDHFHHEVLLSVIDQNNKLISPEDFIQAAEAYGRMSAVDRWVTRNTLKWVRNHSGKMSQLGELAINLSGSSLADDTFLEFLIDELQRIGTDAELIAFEVTETATVGNLELAADFIDEVRSHGCKFALDDFGSGLASYAYLKNLPVDYLKIDGVFIKDIAHSPSDLAMVKSINDIAHLLGKKTIAEFVESDAVMQLLRQNGIDYAQGWGVEKPILFSDL